jgi:hypothetical protein
MVADRLQVKIMSCIHKNQYGFIKGRTVHDSVAWSFEYLHQCKSSGKKIVLLKLDFEKAFDTIEHEVTYQILRRRCFPGRFVGWVKQILESGTSSVLVNGVPGRSLNVEEGSSRATLYPLSFFFVLGADLFQDVINELRQRGLLNFPIDIGDMDFLVI